MFTRSMNNIGLCSAFDNPAFPKIPPTHNNGSKPISSIYCSKNLQITQTGILQKYTGIRGDYKNMFIDIDVPSMLGESMYYKVVRPEIRRLKLNDPRIYNKFLKYTELHLRHNNVLHKSSEILSKCSFPPTKSMLLNQETIDDQLGRAISTGLKKYRTLHMGNIPSSALLTELRNINRFWLILYNKKVGKNISNTLMRRLSKKVNISNYASIPLKEIKYKLIESKRRYKSFVPHAPDERMKQLEELASVYAMEGLKSKSSALKQIMNTESSRTQSYITRSFFPKKLVSAQVDKVQYYQNSTIKETNKPNDLVRVLQNENKDKYSCTNSNPLMKSDLHSKLGNFAETSYAQALLYDPESAIPY